MLGWSLRLAILGKGLVMMRWGLIVWVVLVIKGEHLWRLVVIVNTFSWLISLVFDIRSFFLLWVMWPLFMSALPMKVFLQETWSFHMFTVIVSASELFSRCLLHGKGSSLWSLRPVSGVSKRLPLFDSLIHIRKRRFLNLVEVLLLLEWTRVELLLCVCNNNGWLVVLLSPSVELLILLIEGVERVQNALEAVTLYRLLSLRGDLPSITKSLAQPPPRPVIALPRNWDWTWGKPSVELLTRNTSPTISIFKNSSIALTFGTSLYHI